MKLVYSKLLLFIGVVILGGGLVFGISKMSFKEPAVEISQNEVETEEAKEEAVEQPAIEDNSDAEAGDNEQSSFWGDTEKQKTQKNEDVSGTAKDSVNKEKSEASADNNNSGSNSTDSADDNTSNSIGSDNNRNSNSGDDDDSSNQIEVNNDPYFIDIEAIKNRVNSNSWAAKIREDLFAKANLWLNRTPFFYEKSTDYGYRGDMVCPVESSALMYSYQTGTPSSITCPGADCVYNTSDDHILDSSCEGWNTIAESWNAMWLCDHLDAAQTLGLAYLLADSTDVNREKYGQKAAEILKKFVEVYDEYELHDMYGCAENDADLHHQRGKSMVTWLEEAQYIAIPAAWSYDFLYDSGYLTDSDKENIEKMLISAISDVIIPGTISGRGGNGTTGTNNWYSYAYAAAMTVGQRLNIEDYKSYALSGVKYQMENRVESDGFWWEGTLGYHNMVLNAYFYLCESAYMRGQDNHLDLYNEYANLKNMYYAVCNAAFPDDLNVQMNNEGGSNSSLYSKSTAINLEVANTVFKDSQFDKYLNQIGTKVARADYMSNATNFETGGFISAAPLLIGSDITDNSEITYASEADYEGLGSLRTITFDESGSPLFASLDHGVDGASHAHFDKLNLLMSTKGQIIGKDLGTCSYGSLLKTEYYKNTIAHNTVTVNETSQAAVKGKTETLRTMNRMAVSGASAVNSYEGSVNKYRRTLISAAPYVIDIFNVAGNAGGTYDWTFQNVDSTLSINGVVLSEQTGKLGTDNGYQHIEKVSSGTVEAGGQYSALFNINNESGLAHKITFLPNRQMEVYNTMAPGQGSSPSIQIPKLVVRANAAENENVEFVAIHETIEGNSQIRSIEKENEVIKITKTSGDIEYITYDIEQGAYDFISVSDSGIIKNLETIGSTSVTVGNQNYLTTTNSPEYFSAEIVGKTLKIEHAPYDLGDVSFYVGDADVERVVVNGYVLENCITNKILSYSSQNLPNVSIGWDFSNDTQNWSANRSVGDFTYKAGGYIGGTVLDDAKITSAENLNVSITDNKIVRIKLRNDTSATNGKLYFMTDDDTSWSDKKSVEFSINAHDTAYTEYIIDMTNIPEWTGTLKQLRIDPADKVKGGFFAIDHVWITAKMTDGASVSDSMIIQATPASIIFTSCDEGTSSEEVQSITITNISDVTITLDQPTATNYTIGNLSKTQLAANETATFTVTPNAGLKEGVYSEVIEVSTTDGEMVSVFVSFGVNHVHEWGTVWSKSRTHHWKECEKVGCDLSENTDKGDYGRHQYLDDNDTTCELCQYTRKIYTEEQPVVIKAWDFDNDAEGWNTKNVNGFTHEAGGYIGGTMATGDPRLISQDNLGIDITDYPLLVIKMKNDTSSDFGTIYYATNESPGFSEEKSINFAIKQNDDIYREYVIDLSEDTNWTGTLKQLRLDPNNGVNVGSFSIDSIYIAYKEEDITLDKESLKLADLEEGYASGEEKTVTITNTGSQTIVLEQPTAENFVVGELSKTQLAVRETATFTVTPKQGLQKGTYSEEIIVKTTNETTAKVVVEVEIEEYIETIVAKRWEFNENGNTEGWSGKNIADMTVQDGYLNATFNHGDPRLEFKNASIDITETPYLIFKMKNGTSATKCTVVFSTDNASNVVKAGVEILTPNDADYKEYMIDMSDVTTWTGTLTYLRLDPTDDQTGTFSIDYIYIANQNCTEEISLDKNVCVFDSLEEGYASTEMQTITITNTGNKTIVLDQPTAENFVVGELSKTQLAVRETATFTVTPKQGLQKGTYSEEIIVKTTNETTAKVVVEVEIEEYIETIVAKRWEFNENGNTEGWSGKNIADMTVQDGYLNATFNHGDPRLEFKNASIDITETPYLIFKMKNGTSATKCTVVFSTDNASNVVKAGVEILTPNDADYKEYMIDMSDVTTWTGTLTYLRLDPIDDYTGTFSIDYISIASMQQ